MKTSFLPRNRYRNSSRRKVIYAIIIFIFCAVFFALFGGTISDAFAPIWRSDNALFRGFQNTIGFFRSKSSLINENEDLKQKLASDEDLIISLRSIASSRDDLLAAFGRIASKGTPASVLVHPPETPYDVLVIDIGENLGIKAGAQVTTPEGEHIGMVSDVFSRTSRVRLYSTAGEKTDAVLERGNVPVSLDGRGGGNFLFTLPKSVPVSLGDRVLSPELDSSLIAVVGDIEQEPTDSFKTVYARSVDNPASLRYVIVK